MSGHQAIGCINEVACAICQGAGREYKHRAGSTENCKGNPEKGLERRGVMKLGEQEEMKVVDANTEDTERRSGKAIENNNAP